MSDHNSVLVRLGFEPATSRSADRRLSNWANGAVPCERKFLSGMAFGIYEVVCAARSRVVVKKPKAMPERNLHSQGNGRRTVTQIDLNILFPSYTDDTTVGT